jgi:hypothetical protein
MTIGTPEFAQLLMRIVVYGSAIGFAIYLVYDRCKTKRQRGINR